jgi:hypothetical protein
MKGENMFGYIVGGVSLMISVVMIWACSEVAGALILRSVIERRILGGRPLKDPDAWYTQHVGYLQLPLLTAAVFTIIPMTNIKWDFETVLVYSAGFFLIWLWQACKHVVRGIKAWADGFELRNEKLKPKKTRKGTN